MYMTLEIACEYSVISRQKRTKSILVRLIDEDDLHSAILRKELGIGRIPTLKPKNRRQSPTVAHSNGRYP
uniref:Transposase n=1 Tax=Romanomermis culicivorax TaxID=13658 RepID=A0A915K3Z0_ROMCU